MNGKWEESCHEAQIEPVTTSWASSSSVVWDSSVPCYYYPYAIDLQSRVECRGSHVGLPGMDSKLLM